MVATNTQPVHQPHSTGKEKQLNHQRESGKCNKSKEGDRKRKTP